MMMASMMALTATGAEGQSALRGCVKIQLHAVAPVSPIVVLRARATAAAIFGEIGVAVYWAKSEAPARGAACFPIDIQIDRDSPTKLQRDAMAFALPYSHGGTQIHVFLDRVLQHRSQGQDGVVLGYVMAHEIGHVLEGISRHSTEGVMKAHWHNEDFAAMFTCSLAFAATDMELIQTGLSKMREAALLAAN